MRVPLLDLHLQNLPLKGELQKAIDDVMADQHFILGPHVALFETTLATSLGIAHAVSCANGSDALLLSLMASDLQASDGVITVPFTFFATAGAIHRLGAKIFFVDIDPKTFTLDPRKLSEFLETQCERRGDSTYHKVSGRRLHSIIPVHLFGQCADMDAIMALARQWKLIVIEDAAQALGATYKGKPAGTLGDFGCFSFFPTKNLGAMGDGGMITTADSEAAERLRLLRVHGAKPRYHHKRVGINSRLDTLQAAILLTKWPHLGRWTEQRREHAMVYDRRFQPFVPALRIPFVSPDNRMIYNQYCIRTAQRNALRDVLTKAEIGTEIYYPVPLHLQECFAELGFSRGHFPESEKACDEILALPIFPELTSDQLDYVASTVETFFNSHRSAARE